MPVIIADDLNDAQAKAYRLADNKTAEFAEWDVAGLAEELKELEVVEFDMVRFGFEPFDNTEVQEDDFDVDAAMPEVPITKHGDIWQLGKHRLMCGDSTDKETVEKLMNGQKADLVFTDPPYNVSFNGRSGKFEVIKNDNLNENDFNAFILKAIEAIKNTNAHSYYICCNWKFYSLLMTNMAFDACIVWAKNVFGLGRGYRHQHEFILFNGFINPDIKNESDLWEISKATNYTHPTQRPIELSARAIKNSSKEKNNVVDLFGGSGSTLMACEQLNRICYMMELDEKYCDVIVKRWEQFTGQKAVLINAT